ncbi:MAG: recombinase family protein [Bacteroidales bacterium]|nr:recombinase family protein [Bacteroidales bacterium]
MSTYAYLRVSTQMQTLENQKIEIEKWCEANSLKVDFWVMESVSGTVSWEKRRLGRTIRRMKKGDLLLSTEISRLGRNMLMIMSVLNFCSQRGIRIHTIKDNFDLSDNINSKIIAFAFALAAEIERNLISQRTREALAARKLQGVRLGRPIGISKKVQKVYDDIEVINQLIGEGVPKSVISKMYKVHRNTVSKCLKSFKDK